jgi:hypothetical protein
MAQENMRGLKDFSANGAHRVNVTGHGCNVKK